MMFLRWRYASDINTWVFRSWFGIGRIYVAVSDNKVWQIFDKKGRTTGWNRCNSIIEAMKDAEKALEFRDL